MKKPYSVVMTYAAGREIFVQHGFAIAENEEEAIALTQKSSAYPERIRETAAAYEIPGSICLWNKGYDVSSNDYAISVQYPRIHSAGRKELHDLLMRWQCIDVAKILVEGDRIP